MISNHEVEKKKLYKYSMFVCVSEKSSIFFKSIFNILTLQRCAFSQFSADTVGNNKSLR